MIAQSQQPIRLPFRGATLYIIDIEGDPYTPMKPIVEGMELDWKTQYRKLETNKKRWGMVIMTIPSFGGNQETICLPLRKLHGWLMTISPNKVKPEIRDTIIAYQNECDDVLWQYWTQGHAVNPRMNLPQDFHSDLRTMLNTAQAMTDAIRAFADKYASHATSELSPNSLTCPHIVNCEQRTQPQLPNSTASTLAVTSQVQPCADVIFLAVLWEVMQSQPFTASELYRVILTQQHSTLSDAAIELLGDTATWTARKLGQMLGRWSRTEVSCYRMLNTGTSKNGILWRLEQVS